MEIGCCCLDGSGLCRDEEAVGPVSGRTSASASAVMCGGSADPDPDDPGDPDPCAGPDVASKRDPD
eukprot:1093805-Rhodomonas_salina.1